ncbi:MAG: CoA pyrophosphatase [Pseudomonadota bacterium]
MNMELWQQRLSAALQSTANHDIDDELRDERYFGTPERGYVDAAVLIPITRRPEPGLLLTQRPETMRSHPGQVAFPGGKVDPEDQDAIATALREANEELAIPAEAVEVIGTGECYHSASGFSITPVVAFLPADLPLMANPAEVADWFEMPFTDAVDHQAIKRRYGHWKGHRRGYYELIWQKRRIWGVTAGILANLARQIAAVDDHAMVRDSGVNG